MKIKNKVFLIIGIQITLILGISLYIFYIKNNSKININNLKREEISKNKESDLKFFYDPGNNKGSYLQKLSWNKNQEIFTLINSNGLYETNFYSPNTNEKTYRIITLGDSFTSAANIDTKDNWTEILENKLNEKPICKNINKFEIINLAVPGYDIQYEVERYRLKGQKYNPDLVLWMLIDKYRFDEESIKERQECDNLYINNVSKWKDCYEKEIKKAKSLYTEEQVEEKQRKNLEKIREYFNKKIVFIDFFKNHQKIIDNFSNSFDLKDFNYDYNNKKLTLADGHPSTEGHKKIADEIYKQLFKTNQIPCEPM